MSRVGNELNLKRVRFKTVTNPSDTTGVVVGWEYRVRHSGVCI